MLESIRCLSRTTGEVVSLIVGVVLALGNPGGDVYAQQSVILEEIIVTARKREENILDVPISIATMSGQNLESRFSAGETVLALAYAVPGLYAESSNGRGAPRFYIRGLGNADFDQGASQPVLMVMDEVPMELVALKSFPLFDLEQVEVIRGPQGTLFGRNTTAGIIKLDSRRPGNEFEGFGKLSVGSYGTVNFEGAVNAPIVENILSTRVSVLSQNRQDWVSNSHTGKDDVMGDLRENAVRLQLLFTPTDALSILLRYQRRDLDARTASYFRANILTKGSNSLNSNYDRETVFYDGGGNNPQAASGRGISLKIDWDFGNHTLTSITSKQDYDYFARGDIDGGVAGVGPGFILFSSDVGGNNTIDQFTQEVRIASNYGGNFQRQAGVFFFADELITSTEFGIDDANLILASIAKHENETMAAFGQATLRMGDRWSLTAGARYTDDEKDYTPVFVPVTHAPINLSDDNISWDVSLGFDVTESSLLYARIASGFRAPSIQSRNTAFGDPVTTADSETILSYELGWKMDIGERARINAAIFSYTVDDMQLTAIGGGGNFLELLNAAEGVGTGFEIDAEFALTDRLTLSGGYGYNDTEIKDSTLSVNGCNFTLTSDFVNFERICTITDPLNTSGDPIIDGNPFQHVPEWTLNLELAYIHPLSGGAELFFFTDWKFKGETNEFLYESIEFTNDSQFEGGLRAGWRSASGNVEISIFGRNITDEDNLIGGIDFVNLTGYVNQPAIWGIETALRF